jgi:uncharacterized glyoxalase superfamily protein PhnB
VFPAICAPSVAETAAFYRELFGFVDVFAADWYVQLEVPGHPETQIGIVAVDHPSVPEGHRRPPAGVLVSIEVDDVDAAHAAARARGCTEVRPLRDEPWGQRHFITLDPAGTLVDVITPIPVAPAGDEATRTLGVGG